MNYYRIVFLAAVLLLLPGMTQATEHTYTESFKVYSGSEVAFEGYKFRYSARNGEDIVTALNTKNGTSRIQDQLIGRDVTEALGETREIDEDVSYQVMRINADDDGLYAQLEVTATDPIFASAALSTDDPSNVFVAQGDTLEVSLELENTGVVDQTFALNATAPGPIETFFIYDDFEISQITVPSGETETVDLEIEVPENTPVGPQEVEVVASGDTQVSETISFEVRGQQQADPSMRMRVHESFMRLSPGETTTIPVEIRNDARVMLEGISVSAEADDLEVTVPEREFRLRRHDREEMIVQVSVPADANPGDYFVNIEAEADEVDPETSEVRINVTEETMLRYVGIVLMILSIGSLLGVYRKFGRR